MEWFKGRPPVTGFYWVKNDKTNRVLTRVGTDPGDAVVGVEPYRIRNNGFSLAQVYISPYDGRAAALIHGERRSEDGCNFDYLADEEWAGPLPVPQVEEWMGIDTAAVYAPWTS